MAPPASNSSGGTEGDVVNDRRDLLDNLIPIVYDQLRHMARRQLLLREGAATLSPTGLVHEAYLKLVDHSRMSWRDHVAIDSNSR
jgi:hypothetical protein